MTLTLKIENATLLGYDAPQTIGIQKDLIAEISPSVAGYADQSINVQGNLVIPGFVEPHLHLDKALTLASQPARDGSFQEALRDTAILKQNFTVPDIQTRARKVIENEIAFGTTAIRAHVEVDPILQLNALLALLPLKKEYDWGVSLQLCVFAQEGITNQPGTEQLLRQALSMGGDLIGSAPYTDSDPEKNIHIVFDLAENFDCDVDFHLDFLDDDAPMLLPIVVRETMKRGWQNRVCLGHMTRLAGLNPSELERAANFLSQAGISVLALPATDLYMMGRKDTHNVRRGVAPLHQLSDLGVNSAIATNNIQNLFTPFGDGDPLKMCTLLAQVLQLGTPARHTECIEMATTRAARAIGIRNHAIAPNNPADLVILNTRSASSALSEIPIGRITIKNGKIVSQTDIRRNLIPR